MAPMPFNILDAFCDKLLINYTCLEISQVLFLYLYGYTYTCTVVLAWVAEVGGHGLSYI